MQDKNNELRKEVKELDQALKDLHFELWKVFFDNRFGTFLGKLHNYLNNKLKK